METVPLGRVLGTVMCLTGLALCWSVRRTRFDALSSATAVAVAHVRLTPSACWKLLAFVGSVLVPLAAMGLGHYHTVEGTPKVSACARCHVMRPMGNAMQKAARHTLAARHFKHHWIPQNQCDACHSDYGLPGNLQAKREGSRHLARSPTRTSQEPITIRGPFHNEHGLKGHQGMPRFEAVQSPPSVRVVLEKSAMRCLNCHGQAHPARQPRPPGAADSTQRMEAVRGAHGVGKRGRRSWRSSSPWGIRGIPGLL